MYFRSAFGRPEGHKRVGSVGKSRLGGKQSAKLLFSVQGPQTINEEIELASGESKGNGEPPGPAAWLESKSLVSAIGK